MQSTGPATPLILLHEHFYTTPSRIKRYKMKACPLAAALKLKAKLAAAEEDLSRNGTPIVAIIRV